MRTLLLLILLIASLLLPARTAAQATIEIEAAINIICVPRDPPNPNDPNRTATVPFAEFADVPDATGYTFYGTDNGRVITRTGPPFNDSWSWGPNFRVEAPEGIHRFALAALSSGDGCHPEAYESRFTAERVVVTLDNDPPTAYFTWEESTTTPLTIDFDASASSDPEDQLVAYEWDFGDGNTGQGEQPSHTYTDVGSYTVELTVRDDVGQEDTHTEQVAVRFAEMRYVVSLAVASGSSGKHSQGNDPVMVEVGDTLLVHVQVENTGPIPIENIRLTTPPEIQAEVEALESLGYTQGDHIALLQPDDQDTIVFAFEATHIAQFTGSVSEIKGEVYDPAKDERWPVIEAGVCEIGQKQAGGSVACAEGEVTASAMQVEADLILASGLASSAPSGLKDVGGSVSHQTLNADLRLVCRSGCVDVRVRVLDPATGDPIEGADVRIGAPPLSGASIVTPDQGGGFFCTREATPTCGDLLAGLSDEDGYYEALYLFPGVIAPVPTNITVVVNHPDYRHSTNTLPLTLEPNVPVDATYTLNANDGSFVEITTAIRQSANIVNLLSEGCKYIAEKLLMQNFSVYIPPLDEMGPTEVDFACRNAPNLPIVGDIVDGAKKLSEISQVAWFLNTFQVQGYGLSDWRLAPPPAMIDGNSDFFKAINDAIQALVVAPGSARGSTLALKVYEVSYLGRGAMGAQTNPVEALYFDLTITPSGSAPINQTALVRRGYDAHQWLSPPPSTLLQATAQPGDTQLEVPSNTAQKSAVDSSFALGDFIVIDPGSAHQEVNQIIGFGSFLLAAPLRFSHAAGTVVRRVAPGIVAAPPPPYPFAPADSSDNASITPELIWTPSSLQTMIVSFDVQVATDTSFQTLVLDTTQVQTTTLDLGGLWAGTTYYWRVRGTNMVGEGAWSPRATFTTRPTGTGIEDEEETAEASSPPDAYVLAANYPNPFNPQTTIAFALPQAGPVRLGIYDVLGREIAVLIDSTFPAGQHETVFDAAGLPSGIYLYRLQTQDQTRTRTMLLLK